MRPSPAVKFRAALAALLLSALAVAACPPASGAVTPEAEAESRYREARRLLDDGETPGAIALLEEAEALQPGRSPVLLTLGHAYLDNGDFDAALGVARRLRESGAGSREALDLLYRLADEFETERQRVLAISGIVRRQAAEVRAIIDDVRPALMFQRAGELRRAENFRDAAVFYEEAIRSENRPARKNDYGTAYLGMAREIFRAAFISRSFPEEEARALIDRINRFLSGQEQDHAAPADDEAGPHADDR